MADFDHSLQWLAGGQASLGELSAVLPLEEGPATFARLVQGLPRRVQALSRRQRTGHMNFGRPG